MISCASLPYRNRDVNGGRGVMALSDTIAYLHGPEACDGFPVSAPHDLDGDGDKDILSVCSRARGGSILSVSFCQDGTCSRPEDILSTELDITGYGVCDVDGDNHPDITLETTDPVSGIKSEHVTFGRRGKFGRLY